jgi:Tol biopolymer transport system component
MKRTVFWKNRFILVGMIVLALLFINACSGDEYPKQSSKDEAITYLADPISNAEIWGMWPDGSQKTLLVQGSEGREVVQQTLSPDGRTMVYVVHSPRGQMLSQVLETGAITILVDDGGTSFDPTPSYSYDGTKIVYCMSDGNSVDHGIRIMNADGTNIQVLTELDNDVSPAFNRDGTKIVFDRGWNGSIVVMNADGSGLTVVKYDTEDFSYGHPQFLPDGRIVCMRDGISKDIVIMNADGSNEINLTPDTDASDEFAPTVNNAGNKIAFATDRNDADDIYVGTLTGDSLTDLKNLTEDVDYDCWRPRFSAIPIMP